MIILPQFSEIWFPHFLEAFVPANSYVVEWLGAGFTAVFLGLGFYCSIGCVRHAHDIWRLPGVLALVFYTLIFGLLFITFFGRLDEIGEYWTRPK